MAFSFEGVECSSFKAKIVTADIFAHGVRIHSPFSHGAMLNAQLRQDNQHL